MIRKLIVLSLVAIVCLFAIETKAEMIEFINPVENGVVTVDYNVDKGLKCIHIRGADVTDNSLDVLAAADGEVVAVVESANGLFGVLVDHGDGYQTKYGGLESVNFAENDVVNQGDIIGETDTNSMSFVIIHDGERLVNTKELIGIE